MDAAASTPRATVIAEPPPFAERPVITADHTPATVAALAAVGLASLPPGFQLIRAERQGSRAVAISVSQALDPTGEVSRGGYWVHLSTDRGRHWARSMYTGLAERFPYVVEKRSPAVLLVGEASACEPVIAVLRIGAAICERATGWQRNRMRAFKFRPSSKIEFALDILINRRLHCADWRALNDPMEGLFVYATDG